VVEPSGSTQTGAVTAKAGKDSPSSIREAFALAKKQLASWVVNKSLATH